MGLKEAKDAIDALERQLGLARPQLSPVQKSLLFWLVLVVVGSLIYWYATPR